MAQNVYDLLTAAADYPSWSGPPRRTLVICTQQRSGSTLLGEALHFAGGLGCPLEYFHAGFRPILEERWKPADVRDYAAALFAHRTDPSGVFSVKLFWRDLAQLMCELAPETFATFADGPADQTASDLYMRSLAMLGEFLPNPTFVRLVRRDKIRQAISLSIAGQTNLWRQYSLSRPDGAQFQPVYIFDDIVQFLAGIQNSDAHWRNFFRANALAPHEIAYEDLVADYEGTVTSVLRVAGQPHAAVAPPRLHRHLEDHAKEWVDRFAEDFHGRTRG